VGYHTAAVNAKTQALRWPFRVDPSTLLRRSGVVTEALGTVVRARGVQARVGERCTLHGVRGGGAEPMAAGIDAEVIGLRGEELLLMPFGGIDGVGADAEVRATGSPMLMPVGPQFLGRVIDARGQPIDGGAPIEAAALVNLQRAAPSPMTRQRIDQVFATGVRSIDTLCTIGRGQRVGIFAPAGTGKSVLLGMLAQHARCEVVVLALIGERGREVRDFVEDNLGAEGMRRTVVVVATADTGPIERTRAAFAATALAEHFRDAGRDVLLMVDSLTRFARAQREIGLARGEPPTRRGYPPSLFAVLPQLLERAGNSDLGHLTAFYTVLMEDEMTPDPVAEEVRSLLDGHLVLTRRQAERGIYPALDPNASLSRLMSGLVAAPHANGARRVRELLARHADTELLVQVGEYRRGQDAVADEALDRHAAIVALLRQSQHAQVSWAAACTALQQASGVSA
jgi:ATP synthase in type III secretion protein N